MMPKGTGGGNLISKAVFSRISKTRLCLHHSKGVCERPDCRFAHSEDELRERPDLTKTKMCTLFAQGDCPNEASCKFAHDEKELRATADLHKTSICPAWRGGGCGPSEECRFAHGIEDLRVRPDTSQNRGKNSRSAAKKAKSRHPIMQNSVLPPPPAPPGKGVRIKGCDASPTGPTGVSNMKNQLPTWTSQRFELTSASCPKNYGEMVPTNSCPHCPSKMLHQSSMAKCSNPKCSLLNEASICAFCQRSGVPNFRPLAEFHEDRNSKPICSRCRGVVVGDRRIQKELLDGYSKGCRSCVGWVDSGLIELPIIKPPGIHHNEEQLSSKTCNPSMPPHFPTAPQFSSLPSKCCIHDSILCSETSSPQQLRSFAGSSCEEDEALSMSPDDAAANFSNGKNVSGSFGSVSFGSDLSTSFGSGLFGSGMSGSFGTGVSGSFVGGMSAADSALAGYMGSTTVCPVVSSSDPGTSPLRRIEELLASDPNIVIALDCFSRAAQYDD